MPSTIIPIGRDSVTGQVKTFATGDTLLGTQDVVELNTEYLLPEVRVSSRSTVGDSATFSGASFYVQRQIQFNRIIIQATAKTGSPTLRLLIFQSSDGTASNTVTRVATCTAVAITGAGTYVMTPSEGTVTLKRGICFVLFGNDAGTGSFTLRSHGVTSFDLLNTNIDADCHPVTFTTTISATTTPATIDIRQPATGNLTGTNTNVALIVVLKKV